MAPEKTKGKVFFTNEDAKRLLTQGPHVTIPEGFTSIDAGAFYDCKTLEGVTIPKSVTNIGSRAFADCTALKKVIFAWFKKPGVFTLKNIQSCKGIVFAGRWCYYIIDGNLCCIRDDGTANESLVEGGEQKMFGPHPYVTLFNLRADTEFIYYDTEESVRRGDDVDVDVRTRKIPVRKD